MEEYYFAIHGQSPDTFCVERCMVKDNGVMIGSVKCQECEYCIEHEMPCRFTGDVNWIKCKKIQEATDEQIEK